MLKALIKGAGLFSFGLLSGGTKLYRHITQNMMGTMESHITKVYNIYRRWEVYLQGKVIS